MPMQKVTRRQATEILRGLGYMTDGGNNPYDETEVFRGGQGTDYGYALSTTPQQVVKPNIILNQMSYASYPFAIDSTVGSTQILPVNQRRTFLLVQNQDATGGDNLYFNFSSGAGVNVGVQLTPGEGIVLDINTPNNSVFVYFDASTPKPGVVVEGAPTI